MLAVFVWCLVVSLVTRALCLTVTLVMRILFDNYVRDGRSLCLVFDSYVGDARSLFSV